MGIRHWEVWAVFIALIVLIWAAFMYKPAPAGCLYRCPMVVQPG